MSNIVPITDFTTPELDIYARLSENQLLHYYEPNNGIFIAESPKVIDRALDQGYTPISMLVEDKQIAGQASQVIARCKDIPVYTASFDVLTRLTGFQLTRGILCAMRRRDLPDIRRLCAKAHRIAVLEHIMNPTNVGAIFRCAAALGMDAVLLTPSCADPLYRRAIRVSMGTVFQIPWTLLCQELPVPVLKELGFKTAAMALSNQSIGIDDLRLMAEDKLALILGSEGEGLAGETIADSDYVVRIPMAYGVDSLNVAAASAVAFWELRRR